MLTKTQNKELPTLFTVVYQSSEPGTDKYIHGLTAVYNEKLPLVFAPDCCFVIADNEGLYSIADLKHTIKKLDADVHMYELAEDANAKIVAYYADGVVTITDYGKNYISDADVAKFESWLQPRIPLIEAVYAESLD